MKIIKIITGIMSVNTYFLIGDSDKAVVIDCGENYQKIKDKETELGVKITDVLLTHAHFDHSSAGKKFLDDGVNVWISDLDAPKLLNDDNLGRTVRGRFDYFSANKIFHDGDVLTFDGFSLKVVLTPGHTDGSVCFITDDVIFSGDTLFNLSIGRTDFPTGDYDSIVKSIKNLYALSGDYKIHPGHGDDTTLSFERKHNMYVKDNG